MMATTSTISLNLKKTYPATPDRVWSAWTDPAKVRQWYAPRPYSIPEIEMDVRPGGSFRIVMENAETHVQQTLTGTYEEVVPQERLVYSWQWHTQKGSTPKTLVTVTFEPGQAQTLVSISHDLFPDVQMRDQHIKGWSACLSQLFGVVEK